jgi:hypothetical protein
MDSSAPPPLPISDVELQRQRTILETKLREVAEETGYAPQTVAWIFTAVVARDPSAVPAEGVRRGLSAEALCEKLIRHANDCCPGELRMALEANHIFCSENVGEIVEGLIDKGLLVREEDDYFTDFDGIFDIEHLGAYLAAHGIRRKWLDWPRVRGRLAIVLCIIGFAIVMLSYADHIESRHAWIGWALGLSGGLLAWLPRFRAKPVLEVSGQSAETPP